MTTTSRCSNILLWISYYIVLNLSLDFIHGVTWVIQDCKIDFFYKWSKPSRIYPDLLLGIDPTLPIMHLHRILDPPWLVTSVFQPPKRWTSSLGLFSQPFKGSCTDPQKKLYNCRHSRAHRDEVHFKSLPLCLITQNLRFPHVAQSRNSHRTKTIHPGNLRPCKERKEIGWFPPSILIHF